MKEDYDYLLKSVRKDSLYLDQFKVIITEFNAHTAGDWDNINSTADNDYEASRIASQIINLIKSKITSLYIFKFSIAPSFAISRDVAKNGLHYGENEKAPFHISDTTLSAESVRLLSFLKNLKIYNLISNLNLSKYTEYLGAEDLNNYYIIIVNDKNDSVNLEINVSDWNINNNTQIITESVSDSYWGEVSMIYDYKLNESLLINLEKFSSTKLTIQKGKQFINKIKAELGCYAAAGIRANETNCLHSIKIGTSNTINHENTNVGLLKFRLDNELKSNFKAILELTVKDLIGCTKNTVLILGLNESNWNENTSSWFELSNHYKILNDLNNGIYIDKIYKNFINWSDKFYIVGHITVNKDSINKKTRVDITNYVYEVIKQNNIMLNLIIYRPFRHDSIKTRAGEMKSDNLSNGSLIHFFGTQTKYEPFINFFFN